jgi:hypothetical protein
LHAALFIPLSKIESTDEKQKMKKYAPANRWSLRREAINFWFAQQQVYSLKQLMTRELLKKCTT